MRRHLCVGATVIFLVWPVASLAGQSDSGTSKSIVYQGYTWAFDEAARAAEVEYCGRNALHVSAPSFGALSVANADFQNGVIEVDLAAPGRDIPGIGFRGTSNGEWRNRVLFQRLSRREPESHEALEQAVVTRRKGTNIVLITHFSRGSEEGRRNWFHVRLVVQGNSVAMFLGGSAEPIMTLGKVLEDGRGSIGLCGNDFYLSNFKLTKGP